MRKKITTREAIINDCLKNERTLTDRFKLSAYKMLRDFAESAKTDEEFASNARKHIHYDTNSAFLRAYTRIAPKYLEENGND